MRAAARCELRGAGALGPGDLVTAAVSSTAVNRESTGIERFAGELTRIESEAREIQARDPLSLHPFAP